MYVTCDRSWFSPVYSTIKTDRHDITEILLKVAVSTINQRFSVSVIKWKKNKTRLLSRWIISSEKPIYFNFSYGLSVKCGRSMFSSQSSCFLRQKKNWLPRHYRNIIESCVIHPWSIIIIPSILMSINTSNIDQINQEKSVKASLFSLKVTRNNLQNK